MLGLRSSLGEDSVDRLVHFWSVALLLILALVSWLLPFQGGPVGETWDRPTIPPPPPPPSLPVIPEYKSECWCPAQFTTWMTAYANTRCSRTFNSVLETGDSDNFNLNEVGNSTHTPMFNTRVTRKMLAAKQEQIDRSYQDFYEKAVRDFKATFGKALIKQKIANGSVTHMVSAKIPFYLFLLAIALKIPHLIWKIVASCNPFNVEGTLLAAVQCQHLDRQTRCAVMEELSSTSANITSSCPRRASVTYMVFKMIVLVVTVAELLYVATAVLPEISNLRQGVQFMEPLPKADPDAFYPDKLPDQSHAALLGQSPDELTGYNGRGLLCDFQIRKLTRIQDWNLECIFTPKGTPSTPSPQETPKENKSGSTSAGSAGKEGMMQNLILHEAMFTAVLAYLIMVAAIVGLKTLSWVCRLAGCHAPLEVKGQTLPMDIVFLVCMSRENTGPLITRDLARMAQGYGKGAKDGEGHPLQEDNM